MLFFLTKSTVLLPPSERGCRLCFRISTRIRFIHSQSSPKYVFMYFQKVFRKIQKVRNLNNE